MFLFTLKPTFNFINNFYTQAFSCTRKSKEFSILKSREIINQNQQLSCKINVELTALFISFIYKI